MPRDTPGAESSPSWRERITVHPAVDLFPPMSEDELELLVEDIRRYGLLEPVVCLEDGTLLDGRNRLDAMERAGLPIFDDDGNLLSELRTAVAVADPIAYVVSVNFHRRHLTAEQRDDVIRKLKAERPELSIRGIAAATHTSKSTAARALAEPAVPSGTPERVTGRDGKSYPAKSSSPREPKAGAAPAQVRDEAIVDFSRLLHQQLRKTLEDLVKLLEDERPQIVALPREKRVALARRYLLALDVNLNDLRPEESSR